MAIRVKLVDLMCLVCRVKFSKFLCDHYVLLVPELIRDSIERGCTTSVVFA